MIGVERFGCSLLVHSIIPSSIKGSVVNYDNGNIRTAEIKAFFFFLLTASKDFFCKITGFHFW